MNRVGAGPKGPLGKSREAAICLVYYKILELGHMGVRPSDTDVWQP